MPIRSFGAFEEMLHSAIMDEVENVYVGVDGPLDPIPQLQPS